MESSSDLCERQRQSGAVFATGTEGIALDGPLPLHFGSPQEEYAAARGTSALFDWSDHGLIELTGADRVRFLHSFCTNDVKQLATGRGCEALIPNVKGRILGDVFVAAGRDSLRLDAGPVPTDRLIAHLERYIINEDVAVADASSEWSELLVMGPAAAGGISPLFGDVGRLEPLEHFEVDCAVGQVRVSRRDVGPQAAYVVCARRAALGEVWERLCTSGIRPAGSAAWTALRIEAGLPTYGVDLTDDNLAQEAGRTQSAISFTKGCYLGQEPIARLDAMGHVNRELRSLRIAGEAIPPRGARALADAAASAAAGSVTSAAFSYGSGSAVALVLLRSSVSATGSQVFIETGTSLSPATVFWFPAERRT